MKKYFFLLVSFVFGQFFVVAKGNAAESSALRHWNINGVTREALVYAPKDATDNPAPVLFAFHGHGGTASHVSTQWNYQKLWPQAIVVYMQGLKTPGQIMDPDGKKTGWQRRVGDQDNRDLAFFDVVLNDLKKEYRIDEKRIYAMGHSNGGSFVYILWQARPHIFAAFAPSAAVSVPLVLNNPRYMPKPALVIAGKQDTLVKYNNQLRMIDALRKRNQCVEGKPWNIDARCMLYPSPIGASIVTYLHSGGHVIPAEVPGIVVKFFQNWSL